jgi:hypothetical protein
MSDINASATSENDKQVPLDTDGIEPTVVEVPDSSPAAPAAAPAAEPPARPAAAQASDDGEHEEYSASVQARINRLTRKMREAERQREEALRYATTVKQEAEQVRARLRNANAGFLNEHNSRLSLEQRQAEALLKHAVSSSDADLTVEAQKRLSDLAIARERFRAAKAQEEQQQAWAQAQAQQIQQAPQVQQPPRPDPKAEAWAGKNGWFGKDEAMTFAAFGIHKRLVEDEGFDPQSEEYYSELDRRIAREFPHKVQSSQPQQAQTRSGPAVSGVSRAAATASARARKVRLTPSQVAIARRLGVPLEEYAKYVKE